MEQKKKTQNERIMDYIEQFGSISTLQAFMDLGVTRLASRICELRKAGQPIVSKTEKVKNRFGEDCHVSIYSFEKEEEEIRQ